MRGLAPIRLLLNLVDLDGPVSSEKADDLRGQTRHILTRLVP